VGGESGSTYWSNDQSTAFVLPNSGLEINLPTRTFETPSSTLREDRGIVPDALVVPSIDDLLAGRDRALEVAINRLRGAE
jgi:hypothetical protein